MKPFLIGAFSLLGLATFAHAQPETYTLPDIRNEFCGSVIDDRYCTCAFTGDHCDLINQGQSDAYTHVTNAYIDWVSYQIETMARTCLAEGGSWDVPSRTCAPGPSPSTVPEAPLQTRPTPTQSEMNTFEPPTTDSLPSRESLVGDTRDIEAMIPTPGGSTLWLWLLGLVGFAGGFWFYRHHQTRTETT